MDNFDYNEIPVYLIAENFNNQLNVLQNNYTTLGKKLPKLIDDKISNTQKFLNNVVNTFPNEPLSAEHDAMVEASLDLISIYRKHSITELNNQNGRI